MNNFIKSDRKEKMISLDIIIPVFNEEEVLDSLFDRLKKVFSSENLEFYKINSVRYLIIDDGSKDRSAEIIWGYIKEGITATLYRFTRNFGHQNAVSAGLDISTSDVVAVIDADLQDPPEVILQMIEKWRDGFNVVYGERRKRKENFIKRSAYWFFYRLLSYLTEIDIPLDSGDFSLMDRKVVKAMCDLPEKIRYPRVIRAWVGFLQTGVPYERDARIAGQSKYSFSNYYKLATDGVASASVRPLRLSQVLSLTYLLILMVLIVFIAIKYIKYIGIVSGERTLSDEMALWFLFCFTLISFGGFVQAFLFYILSAYVGRGYIETKGRPAYVIMETISRDNLTFDSKN